MLLYNARNNNYGFTMIEILTIIVIVGILSAIAAPSFLGMLNRSKVNNAVAQVRGALQEAQREAIRRSKSCTVTLNTTNNKLEGPCLVTGDRVLPDGVVMANNINGGNTITFSIQGNTTFTVVPSPSGSTDPTGKIILYQGNGSNSDKKCVAISSGIGIVRSGTYSGDISAADITNTSCNASR